MQSGCMLIKFYVTCADLQPWNELTELLDDSWYLDCDLEVAMERVVDRFLTMGLCAHDAQHRVDSNDSKNAELIASYANRAQLIIHCAVDEAVSHAMVDDGIEE